MKLKASFFLLCLPFAGCGQSAQPFEAVPTAVGNGPAPNGTSGGNQGPSPAPSNSPSPSASGEPVAPATAKVIDKIENQTGWGHCSDCAADPAKKHPPIASWDFKQFQSTPSKDGSSIRFYVGGSAPYANALHWKKLGDHSDYRNFIWEFYVYGNSDSLKAQNLEFDLFQAVDGRKYMFGTQCNYISGVWQGWNEKVNEWVNFSRVPCKKFKPGTWTRVKWHFQRTSDNRLRYVSLTVGDKIYKIDSYQPSHKTNWQDGFGVQFQQDLNSRADDYALWVDAVKVWMW